MPLLDASGQPVKMDATQRINALINHVENAQRMGTKQLVMVVSELLRGGWEFGHDASLPDGRVMVVTVSKFRRNVNGSLEMTQHGTVACGGAYVAAFDEIKALNEAEMARAAEEKADSTVQ